MLPLNGISIGVWRGYGCAIILQSSPPPFPAGCVAAWTGTMVITQAGTPLFGQQTTIEVFSDGVVYQVNRNCGNGILQSARLNQIGLVQLNGIAYQSATGPSSGAGTGGALCQILAMGQG